MVTDSYYKGILFAKIDAKHTVNKVTPKVLLHYTL